MGRCCVVSGRLAMPGEHMESIRAPCESVYILLGPFPMGLLLPHMEVVCLNSSAENQTGKWFSEFGVGNQFDRVVGVYVFGSTRDGRSMKQKSGFPGPHDVGRW